MFPISLPPIPQPQAPGGCLTGSYLWEKGRALSHHCNHSFFPVSDSSINLSFLSRFPTCLLSLFSLTLPFSALPPKSDVERKLYTTTCTGSFLALPCSSFQDTEPLLRNILPLFVSQCSPGTASGTPEKEQCSSPSPTGFYC